MTFSPKNHPQIIGYVPPEEAAHLGVCSPIPILDLRLADERRWCRAAALWLETGESPPTGCPTGDLRSDGSCRRSPCHGRCLLLLSGDHEDWLPARRWRFDPGLGGFVERDELAPAPTRAPLSLMALHPPSDEDAFLDELARWERLVAAELDELRAEGVAIAVDAHTVVQAELAGHTVNLETGEVE